MAADSHKQPHRSPQIVRQLIIPAAGFFSPRPNRLPEWIPFPICYFFSSLGFFAMGEIFP
jgi:hypothetical protein